MHVTTISRAVDDKWIQTPRGIFPLKRFFVGARAAKMVKMLLGIQLYQVNELIEKEDKQKPYSDDDLVGELSKIA